MNIQLVSDLHLDCYPLWKLILDKDVIAWSQDVDVLVVAGDMAELREPVWLESFKVLSNHYPIVLTVLGNHEHYYSDLGLVQEAKEKLPSNVKLLRRETINIDGVIFGGCTMWYPKQYSKIDREGFDELVVVPGGENWILDESDKDNAFLAKAECDIMITHLAPSYMSVEKRFLGSSFNAFFVCDKEELILKKEYAYWFHGHMHRPSSYQIGKTWVKAAPRGYRGDVAYYSPTIIKHEKAPG